MEGRKKGITERKGGKEGRDVGGWKQRRDCENHSFRLLGEKLVVEGDGGKGGTEERKEERRVKWEGRRKVEEKEKGNEGQGGGGEDGWKKRKEIEWEGE